MRRLIFAVVMILVGPTASALQGAGSGCGHASCTAEGGCPACAPACKATWDEAKTKKPKYSMKCEYACTRGFDPWHAPAPECRCRPPCGDVIVKKRLYKVDGPEKVERVPKYEVQMVAAEPCGCSACRGEAEACWWHPLRSLGEWLSR